MAVLLAPCNSLHSPALIASEISSEPDGRYAIYRVMRHSLGILNELGLAFKQAPYLLKLIDQSDLLITSSEVLSLYSFYRHEKHDDVELVDQGGQLYRRCSGGAKRTDFIRAIEERWLRAAGMVCVTWTCFTCLLELLKGCQVDLLSRLSSGLGSMGSYGAKAANFVQIYYPNSGTRAFQIGTVFLALAKVVDIGRNYKKADYDFYGESLQAASLIGVAVLENYKAVSKSPYVHFVGFGAGVLNVCALYMKNRKQEAKDIEQLPLFYRASPPRQSQEALQNQLNIWNLWTFAKESCSLGPLTNALGRIRKVGADFGPPLVESPEHLDKLSKFFSGTLEAYTGLFEENATANLAMHYIKDCTKLISDTLLFSQPGSTLMRKQDPGTGKFTGEMKCETIWKDNWINYCSIACFQMGHVFGFMRLLDDLGVGIFKQFGQYAQNLPVLGSYAAKFGLKELKYWPVVAGAVLGVSAALYDIMRVKTDKINDAYVVDKGLKLISNIAKGILVWYILMNRKADYTLLGSGLLLGPANFAKYLLDHERSQNGVSPTQPPSTPAARYRAAVHLPESPPTT